VSYDKDGEKSEHQYGEDSTAKQERYREAFPTFYVGGRREEGGPLRGTGKPVPPEKSMGGGQHRSR